MKTAREHYDQHKDWVSYQLREDGLIVVRNEGAQGMVLIVAMKD